MRKLVILVVAVVALAALVGGGLAIAGPGENKGIFEFEAQVATGQNRLFGEPLFTFPFPDPVGKLGFETLGVFNPDGPNPLPLTASTPDDAILATSVDPFLDELFPVPVASTVDPALINVPLRDIETWVPPPNLMVRSALPFHLDGPVIGSTQAGPNGPITKGDWFEASGKIEIKCDKTRNSVKIHMKDLIPNRLYTAWGIWLNPEGVPPFIPVPLGGVPNVIITDEKGNANYERELNFCPVEAALEGIDGKTLTFIDVHLHSDHVAYGAIPVPLLGGFPPGTVIHAHLAFNMGAGVPNAN